MADIRAGFAARGAGAGAVVNGGYVTESFLPDLSLTGTTVSDAQGNNNGAPDPGEDLILGLTVSNSSNAAVAAVVAVGTYTATSVLAPGGGLFYQAFPYRVPATATAGSTIQVPVVLTGKYGSETRYVPLTVGTPTYAFAENFDGVTAPALPAGWSSSVVTGTATAAPTLWKTATSPVVEGGNHVFAPDVSGSNANGTGSEEILVSPTYALPNASGLKLVFKHLYDFETYAGSYLLDGGVLEIKVGTGGTFTDIVTAGGSFAQGGYTGTINASYGNPLKSRSAWIYSTGSAPITTVVNLPASAAGQSVQFRWRLGCDINYAAVAVGWRIDGFQILSGYTTATVDTDGDGLQDGYELAYGLNPNDPADAARDSDGDGVSNLQEYLAGTDPRNAASTLRITQSTYSPTTGLTVNFPTVNGKVYQLEYKDDLTAAAWTTLPGTYTGNGTTFAITFSPTDLGGRTTRFYRVRVTGP